MVFKGEDGSGLYLCRGEAEVTIVSGLGQQAWRRVAVLSSRNEANTTRCRFPRGKNQRRTPWRRKNRVKHNAERIFVLMECRNCSKSKSGIRALRTKTGRKSTIAFSGGVQSERKKNCCVGSSGIFLCQRLKKCGRKGDRSEKGRD